MERMGREKRRGRGGERRMEWEDGKGEEKGGEEVKGGWNGRMGREKRRGRGEGG